jgi:DNA-binding NarL/FixJ family response regulator
MPIRLVLADDHLFFREALQGLLLREADFHLVAGCQNGEETLHAVRQHCPDVLLLALCLSGKNGLEVLRAMRQAKLPTRVVLLANSLYDDALLEALLLGVEGVVVRKARPSQQLVASIRKVWAGDQWLECGTVGAAVETLLRREVAAREQPGSLYHKATADPEQGRG